MRGLVGIVLTIGACGGAAAAPGDKPAAPNLEIILDVSGSMNAKLGETSRWQTALKVLDEVVGTLPADLNVGLRVYGHRYSSSSAQTCQDTELVVPIAPLDRPKLLEAASKLQPRGETPLIRSDDVDRAITEARDIRIVARRRKAHEVRTRTVTEWNGGGLSVRAKDLDFAGVLSGHPDFHPVWLRVRQHTRRPRRSAQRQRRSNTQ